MRSAELDPAKVVDCQCSVFQHTEMEGDPHDICQKDTGCY